MPCAEYRIRRRLWWWAPLASGRSMRSVPRRSTGTGARLWQPAPACSIRSANCSPPRLRQWRSTLACRIFPTTPRMAGARPVMAPDLLYLPESPMTCPACNGNRHALEVERIRWNGRTIADVLTLGCAEAVEVLQPQPWIHLILQAIVDAMSLWVRPRPICQGGEATPHLSGGGGTAPAAGRADTPPSGQRAAHL